MTPPWTTRWPKATIDLPFEQHASGRDDFAHGGVVIEPLRCDVSFLDDTTVRVGDPEARRDADALHLPAK